MDRIVVGTTGGADLPHMKYRLGPLVEEGRWPVEVIAVGTFPGPEEIDGLLAAGGPDAMLALQRVLPSAGDMERLRSRYHAVVFDFDDAIYAAMPEIGASSVRRAAKGALRVVARGSPTASRRRRPLIKVLRRASASVAGNEVLVDFARRYSQRVVEIPSTVDPIPSPPASRPEPPVLVWTGVAGNRQYLELVREPLARLAREYDFRLRVVCSLPWDDPRVDVEFVSWSAEAEREALLTATAGLAPVSDDPFSRGKCQYRSIVFGGHALATVASPVGIMNSIITQGETGFLAHSADEWVDALRMLVTDPGLAARLGENALERVRARYSHQVGLERWTRLFDELAAAGAAPA